VLLTSPAGRSHGRRRLTGAAIIRYYQRSGLPDLYSLTD
jgi:hypothetical protein